MNSKTIIKPGSVKIYLRQDKNYCLVSKTCSKKLPAYNPITKNWKKRNSNTVTENQQVPKSKPTFLKEIKPIKKMFKLQNI